MKDKEGHYTMIKGEIQQENITLINIYVSNRGPPKYVKQILMDIREEINSNTAIIEDFNTTSISMDRSSRQKIDRATVALNDTLDPMNLIYILRAFHPTAAEYALFSSSQGTFSKIEHMLRHKTRINKFKNTEIISSIFSDQIGMKLEVNHKKKLKNIQRHRG